MADDFSFEITEQIGVVAPGKGGWNLELNMISWGGRHAKYDLRSWSSDHKKMSKGITLTKDELLSLKNLLETVQIS